MSNKKHDLILKALLLSATHLQLLKDDEYGGSEAEVELSNSCYELLCDIVGFDIAEDDKWGGYTIRATDEEITQYGIDQLLSRYPEVCPTGKRSYIVAFEALYQLDDWRNIDELDVRIWDENVLTVDSGWEPEDAHELSGLKVNDALISYGLFGHSIFRLK